MGFWQHSGLESGSPVDSVLCASLLGCFLETAELIKDEFFRLRAKAVLCLLRLTGKRREEIAKVQFDFVKIEYGFLSVTFELEKKKRRKKCGSNISEIETRSNKKPDLSTKSIPLTDPLAQPISKYVNYLRNRVLEPKFLFPSGKSVFGNYFLIQDRHLTGRQIFNIVRNISETIWPHLFRETVGADVIKADSTIIGAFKVMNRLDLENYETGFHYLKRYASDIIQREEEKIVD